MSISTPYSARFHRYKALAVSGAALVFGVLAAGLDPKRVLAAACGLGGILIALHPAAFFILFFLGRSSADLFAHIQAAGVNPAGAATLGALVAGCAFLARREPRERFARSRILKRFNLLFLLFLAVALLSFGRSGYPAVAAADWLRLASVAMVFNVAYLGFSGEQRLSLLTKTILISAALPLAFGFHQFLTNTGFHFTRGFNRVYGTFLHPNVFAQFLLVMVFTLLTHEGRRPEGKGFSTASAFLLCVMLFEIYQTYTRSVWLSLFITLVLYSLRYRFFYKKVFYYILLAAVIALLFENIRIRFLDIFYPGMGRASSLQWRLMVWENTLQHIPERLFLGHGLGTFEIHFAYMAHNDYLRLAYETGLFGVVTYLLPVGYLLRVAAARSIGAKERDARLNITALCLLTGLLMMSVGDNLARSTVILAYLYAVVGAVLGTEHEEEESGPG